MGYGRCDCEFKVYDNGPGDFVSEKRVVSDGTERAIGDTQ